MTEKQFYELRLMIAEMRQEIDDRFERLDELLGDFEHPEEAAS